MNFNTFSEEENDSMNNFNGFDQDKFFYPWNLFKDSFLQFEQSNIFNLNINEEKYNGETKRDNNIEISYLMNEKTGFTSKNPLESFEIANKIKNKYSYKKKDNKKRKLKGKIDNKLKVNNAKPPKEKKLLGRKKKDSNEKGFHNRNTEDNMTIKCKHLILGNTLKYLNNRIKKLYNNNIYVDDDEIELKKINQGQILSSKADYNKEFLHKTLGEIFSDNISTKYSTYPLTHNKNVINNLLNEKDEEKRKVLKRLFNLTFLDCLNHFIGKKPIQELEGFIKLDEACSKLNLDEEYMIILKKFVINYEEKIMNKKERNREKKKI